VGNRAGSTDPATYSHPFRVPDLRSTGTVASVPQGQWLRTASGTWVQVQAASACVVIPDWLIKLSESHITDTGDAILGHFPGYIEKAKKLGASYYDIGDVWNTLNKDQQWAANVNFLKKVTGKGDRILLSLAKKDIRPGSILEDEVKWLTDHGYVWVNQWSLRPR
jgi:hypothetical protein